MNQNRLIDYEIINTLDKVIRENNIFAQAYEMMRNEINNQQSATQSNNETVPELQLLFSLKPGTDRRKYNFQ